MSSTTLWAPPIGTIVFLVGFAGILWPWQAKSRKDKDESTEHHSERVYKSFEFFVTVALAIVGAVGYVRLEKFDQHKEAVARQAMIGLGAAALAAAASISLFIIIHQGSKLRRWTNIEWAKMPFWLELWMCIVMMSVGITIWLISNLW